MFALMMRTFKTRSLSDSQTRSPVLPAVAAPSLTPVAACTRPASVPPSCYLSESSFSSGTVIGESSAFVFLDLTYFTQHNALKIRPHHHGGRTPLGCW